MPSTSAKQARFMDRAAKSPSFAKSANIPQAVAREFAAADAVKRPGSNKMKTRRAKTKLGERPA